MYNHPHITHIITNEIRERFGDVTICILEDNVVICWSLVKAINGDWCTK